VKVVKALRTQWNPNKSHCHEVPDNAEWRDIAQLHSAERTRLETMPNYLLINHSSPRLPIYKFTSHAATAVGISITHTDEVIPNCTAVALSTPTSELKRTARHNVHCRIARRFRLASSENQLHQPVPSLHHCSAATSGSILIPFISRPNPCNLLLPIPGVTDLEDSWRKIE
jgi:hypothetical protein